MEVHQEELELLLGLVEDLTVGARVERRVRGAVLGLEALPEAPDVRDGVGPAASRTGSSITHSVRDAGRGQAGQGAGRGASGSRHVCSRPRQIDY